MLEKKRSVCLLMYMRPSQSNAHSRLKKFIGGERADAGADGAAERGAAVKDAGKAEAKKAKGTVGIGGAMQADSLGEVQNARRAGELRSGAEELTEPAAKKAKGGIGVRSSGGGASAEPVLRAATAAEGAQKSRQLSQGERGGFG